MPERITALLERDPEGVLFHYTSLASFLELIGEQRLWATNIHYLNDSAEFNHAIDVTRSFLEHGSAKESSFAAEAAELLTRELSSVERSDLYIGAFSSESDLLSQWRGYGSRYGFSAGLDFRGRRQWLAERGFRLGPCVYDDGMKFELIREVYEACLRQQRVGELALPEFCRRFLAHFLLMAPLLKDSSFREEKEWRLISQPVPLSDPRVQFRAGESMIVPYIEFDFSAKDAPPVAAVTIGPNPHMNLSCRSVEAFLERTGCSVDVRPSNIPFRRW